MKLNSFGERLEAALRIRRVQKMYALATMIGVDESAISRWRRGQAISTANLIKLCEALHVSVDWLLTGRGRMQAAGDRSCEWSDILVENLVTMKEAEAKKLAEIFRVLENACANGSGPNGKSSFAEAVPKRKP